MAPTLTRCGTSPACTPGSYADTFALLDIVLAVGIGIAAAVLPLLPVVLLAATAGLFAARGFFGTTDQVPASWERTDTVEQGFRTVSVPVPWSDLLILTAGTIAAVVLTTAAALVFLRRSTSISEVRAAA